MDYDSWQMTSMIYRNLNFYVISNTTNTSKVIMDIFKSEMRKKFISIRNIANIMGFQYLTLQWLNFLNPSFLQIMFVQFAWLVHMERVNTQLTTNLHELNNLYLTHLRLKKELKNQYGWISGFGDNGNDRNEDLNFACVELRNKKVCENLFNNPGRKQFFSQLMICAGGDGIDACNGDRNEFERLFWPWH